MPATEDTTANPTLRFSASSSPLLDEIAQHVNAGIRTSGTIGKDEAKILYQLEEQLEQIAILARTTKALANPKKSLPLDQAGVDAAYQAEATLFSFATLLGKAETIQGSSEASRENFTQARQLSEAISATVSSEAIQFGKAAMEHKILHGNAAMPAESLPLILPEEIASHTPTFSLPTPEPARLSNVSPENAERLLKVLEHISGNKGGRNRTRTRLNAEAAGALTNMQQEQLTQVADIINRYTQQAATALADAVNGPLAQAAETGARRGAEETAKETQETLHARANATDGLIRQEGNSTRAAIHADGEKTRRQEQNHHEGEQLAAERQGRLTRTEVTTQALQTRGEITREAQSLRLQTGEQARRTQAAIREEHARTRRHIREAAQRAEQYVTTDGDATRAHIDASADATRQAVRASESGVHRAMHNLHQETQGAVAAHATGIQREIDTTLTAITAQHATLQTEATNNTQAITDAVTKLGTDISDKHRRLVRGGTALAITVVPLATIGAYFGAQAGAHKEPTYTKSSRPLNRSHYAEAETYGFRTEEDNNGQTRYVKDLPNGAQLIVPIQSGKNQHINTLPDRPTEVIIADASAQKYEGTLAVDPAKKGTTDLAFDARLFKDYSIKAGPNNRSIEFTPRHQDVSAFSVTGIEKIKLLKVTFEGQEHGAVFTDSTYHTLPQKLAMLEQKGIQAIGDPDQHRANNIDYEHTKLLARRRAQQKTPDTPSR